MKYILTFLVLVSIISYIYTANKKPSEPTVKSEVPKKKKPKNEIIDIYNGVKIYNNGTMTNTQGRHLTADGYNLGLKWQCVEFVKRYYYQTYKHKMPNSYGHAKDFFDKTIGEGYNEDRKMHQYKNGSLTPPKEDDIIVFDATPTNQYGHIAIISKVSPHSIQIVQQNWGTVSRMIIPIHKKKGRYVVERNNTLGWLSL